MKNILDDICVDSLSTPSALQTPPIVNQQGTRVAIAGATSYTGAELEKILARHKHAQVVAAFSSGSFSLDALFDARPEIVFLATPNEVSAEIVPTILDAGIKVIDLSGAFRLGEPSLYPSWYGFTDI